MNYIAHIHIAKHTQTSLLGNFLGDFVKGSDLAYLPSELELGIRLHRGVDKFTDSHPLVRQLKQAFPRNLRRMAGVIIDIYFDHLLLNHWHLFSTQSYQSLFSQFYAELETFSLPDPHYTQQASRLISTRWLKEYQHEETCYRAFCSIEKRLKGKIKFAEQAQVFIIHNRQQLATSFLQFYPDLLNHGLQLSQSNPTTRKPPQ
ncbi:ACP phosphodiesterase [Paraglaciecola aquimarina]|uniref:ACP phosphodiesterase n=1 Tax=Paraglaciecola aquimarina TaxID=1235557 RepID=A0ABU3SU10_9ALTE|nr:ACP phosphodiesterase [Paraglaciecola aquimarina]MDU0353494.1 ACP phosphodiesterase [Paraglaciecola aquimarina]